MARAAAHAYKYCLCLMWRLQNEMVQQPQSVWSYLSKLHQHIMHSIAYAATQLAQAHACPTAATTLHMMNDGVMLF